jgi:hypothetical protein
MKIVALRFRAGPKPAFAEASAGKEDSTGPLVLGINYGAEY